MHNTNPGRDLVLFSQDNELLNALFSEAARMGADSPNLVLEKNLVVDRLQQCAGLVIYDLGFVDDNLSAAATDIESIKGINPDVSIILIGEKLALTKALEFDSIKQNISRSYNKPVLASNLMMAIEVLGIRQTETRPEASKIRRKIPLATGILLGLIALIAVAVFLKQENVAPVTISQEQTTPASLEQPHQQQPAGESSATVKIDRLNHLAKEAFEDGRTFYPEGDNALHYFEQALEIDDYNATAYEGRQSILNQIRTDFPTFLESGDLQRANNVIMVIERLEPFSEDIQKMRDMLADKTATKGSIASDDEPTRNNTEPAVNKNAENSSKTVTASHTVSTAAIRSQLIKRIDQAIQSDLLAPPQPGNAFALLRRAIKEKKLTTVEIGLIRKRLAKALAKQAHGDLERAQIDEARIKVAYIEQLDRDNEELTKLISDIRTAQNKSATPAKPDPALETPVNSASQILPPELVERVEPIYPTRAFKFDVEGWVELEYRVDREGNTTNIQVVNAAPNKMFNKAAVDALKQWKFTPAKESTTGNPVESDVNTTKFVFSLGT